MNLRDSFSKYTLTAGQQELRDELDRFLSDDRLCFLLKGYAGTGKTFMMKGLVDHLHQTHRHFQIAAPTGRAAKVIAQKTQREACTIHKLIYANELLDEGKENDEMFKFCYGLKHNEDPHDTIYIIDESSMVSNEYSEEEFFQCGSGFLLHDLIEYVGLTNPNHQRKIIFIGDDAQLPPVKMNFSPALDAEYLQKKFGFTPSEYELTEVVRQRTESGILRQATEMRQSIKAQVFNHLNMKTPADDICNIDGNDFLAHYMDASSHHIDEETIIVSYSNSRANKYNAFIRKQFFGNQQTIAVGDKIILVQNNYSYRQMELYNGDFGLVKSVSPQNEIRTISLKKKDEPNKVSVQLVFRDVVIAFIDAQLQEQTIRCKIIENVLHSGERNLTSDELRALFVDFKIRNSKLRSGTREFREALKTDVYFNALRIKFGYAITCHKAQGGEWNNVFLDCQANMGRTNLGYYRWLYTGVTRAKGKLYTINTPHFNITSNMTASKSEALQERTDLIVLEADEVDMPFDLAAQTDFVQSLYRAISQCLASENIAITAIRHSNYLEHYSFSKGDEVANFRIVYNGKNQISAIQKPTNTNDFSDAVLTKLLALQGKTIVMPQTAQKMQEPTIEFEFPQDFLREHYELRKKEMLEKGIHIVDIEHHNYQEVYTFQRGGLKAVYRFYYNGKCLFTRYDIDRKKTTGLTEEINELLKN
ncbi:MAG: ATP-dependent RecD-like DNA helicase [Mangrovibacterium sp.]